MRYIIQEYRQRPEDPAQAKTFIELDPEQDLGRLFSDGFICLETVGMEGGSFEVYLYLRGRGVNPDALQKKKRRGLDADDIQ